MNTLLLRRQLLFMMNNRALPYHYDDSEVKLDEELLPYFIQRIADVYDDYIEDKWFVIFKQTARYPIYTSEEDGLVYRVHVFNSNTPSSTWSLIDNVRCNFDNFDLNDADYYVQLQGTVIYSFFAGRTGGDYYDGNYSMMKDIEDASLSYFLGDSSYEHNDGPTYEFDYRQFYPIYCNKPIYATDPRGVRGILVTE